MPSSSHVIVPALFVVYLAWRLFRRMRRQIGRQPFQPRRITGRIVIYSFIILLGGALTRGKLLPLAGLGGGLLLGAALAMAGLRLTVFEESAEGKFYTPNTVIGVVLAVLLVGRLAYRMMILYDVSGQQGPAPKGFGQSPLTLAFLGLVFGYYVAYYAGILYRCRGNNSKNLQPAPAVTQPGNPQ
jgi:hypothetical protein